VPTKLGVGLFDFASNVAEGSPTPLLTDHHFNSMTGVRNTTTVFDNPARDRVRLPRLVQPDGILVVSEVLKVSSVVLNVSIFQPYSQREALGQYWLKDVENGRYRKEYYVAHISSSIILVRELPVVDTHYRPS
jgi:vacuolar protein sorting-associated protein 13A/C